MPVPGAYEKHCPVIVFISFFLEIYQEMRDFFFCCHTCTLTNCGVVKCSSFIQPLSGSKVGSCVPSFILSPLLVFLNTPPFTLCSLLHILIVLLRAV